MRMIINSNIYRANATNINVIPRVNPFVLVFEGLEGFNHCMTHFASRRSLKKNPLKLTIFQLSTGEHKIIDNIEDMEKFIEEWRENYFNPDWGFRDFIKREDILNEEN